MMRRVIYHNAGNAGRDHSKLELMGDYPATQENAVVSLTVELKQGRIANVILNAQQVRHMVTFLAEELRRHPPLGPAEPMIEEFDG